MAHINLNIIQKKTGQTLSKPIEQYDLNNNLIKIWESARIAAEYLNIYLQRIILCCNNSKRNKTYKGYVWKYVDDLDLPDEIWIELTDTLHGLYISNKGRYYSKKVKSTTG